MYFTSQRTIMLKLFLNMFLHWGEDGEDGSAFQVGIKSLTEFVIRFATFADFTKGAVGVIVGSRSPFFTY